VNCVDLVSGSGSIGVQEGKKESVKGRLDARDVAHKGYFEKAHLVQISVCVSLNVSKRRRARGNDTYHDCKQDDKRTERGWIARASDVLAYATKRGTHVV
jgi:hypothetical protein